ncbi:hypothetical protein ADUPG1_010219 [Aduncisulcus paluster]|uniref:Uncharacterized protein n=1 Tax=Aduncisulcus paluster TaxID=2918883 RepID=A0ABQ5JQE2_9EUKA|nr:hypothetical protein ADUPG1_010219 [Aduncisulcus paluster]
MGIDGTRDIPVDLTHEGMERQEQQEEKCVDGTVVAQDSNIVDIPVMEINPLLRLKGIVGNQAKGKTYPTSGRKTYAQMRAQHSSQQRSGGSSFSSFSRQGRGTRSSLGTARSELKSRITHSHLKAYTHTHTHLQTHSEREREAFTALAVRHEGTTLQDGRFIETDDDVTAVLKRALKDEEERGKIFESYDREKEEEKSRSQAQARRVGFALPSHSESLPGGMPSSSMEMRSFDNSTSPKSSHISPSSLDSKKDTSSAFSSHSPSFGQIGTPSNERKHDGRHASSSQISSSSFSSSFLARPLPTHNTFHQMSPLPASASSPFPSSSLLKKTNPLGFSSLHPSMPFSSPSSSFSHTLLTSHSPYVQIGDISCTSAGLVNALKAMITSYSNDMVRFEKYVDTCVRCSIEFLSSKTNVSKIRKRLHRMRQKYDRQQEIYTSALEKSRKIGLYLEKQEEERERKEAWGFIADTEVDKAIIASSSSNGSLKDVPDDYHDIYTSFKKNRFESLSFLAETERYRTWTKQMELISSTRSSLLLLPPSALTLSQKQLSVAYARFEERQSLISTFDTAAQRVGAVIKGSKKNRFKFTIPVRMLFSVAERGRVRDVLKKKVLEEQRAESLRASTTTSLTTQNLTKNRIDEKEQDDNPSAGIIKNKHHSPSTLSQESVATVIGDGPSFSIDELEPSAKRSDHISPISIKKKEEEEVASSSSQEKREEAQAVIDRMFSSSKFFSSSTLRTAASPRSFQSPRRDLTSKSHFGHRSTTHHSSTRAKKKTANGSEIKKRHTSA